MGINPMSPKSDRTRVKPQNKQYTDMFVQACRDVDFRAFSTAIKKGADLTADKYCIIGELDPHGYPQKLEFTLNDLIAKVCSKLSKTSNDSNARNILMSFSKQEALCSAEHETVIEAALQSEHWALAKAYLEQNKHRNNDSVINSYAATFDNKSYRQAASKNIEWSDFFTWVEDTYADQFPDELKLKVALSDLKNNKADRLSEILDSKITIPAEQLDDVLEITSSATNLSPDFKLRFLQYYIQTNQEDDSVIRVISKIKEPRLLSKIFSNCDFSETTKNTLLNRAIDHNDTALTSVLLKQSFEIQDNASILNRALRAECDTEILTTLLEKGSKLNFLSLKTIVSEDMIDELALCLKYQEPPEIHPFDINNLFDETRHHIAPQCFLFLATHYGLDSLDGNALENYHQFFVKSNLSTNQRTELTRLVEEENARRELKSLFFGAALQIQYSQNYSNNIDHLNSYFGDIFNQLAKTRKSSISAKEHHDLKQHINNFKNQ